MYISLQFKLFLAWHKLLFAAYNSQNGHNFMLCEPPCAVFTGLPTQINNIHKVALYKAEPFLQW